MEFNLADLFESVADVVPDREALVYLAPDGSERRETYATLDAAANRLAHHLAGAGIGPGHHVGLHLFNGIEYVQGLLACLKIRAVPINVNYRYVEDELAYLYADAELVGLVFDAEFADRVAAAAPRAPRLRHLIQVGTPAVDAAVPAIRPVSFADAEASGSAARGFGPRSGDDQFIIYTGGTTGMPKGVMWRQEDLFFAGMGGGAPMGEPVKTPEELAQRVAAGGDGLVFFPVAPLMHGTATLAAFIGFHFGQKVVLNRKFVPADVLRTVAQERVTSIALVGDAMLRPLTEALAGPHAGADCSSLITVSSSGAILSESIRSQFEQLLPNVFLLDNFGSSESGFNGTATGGSGPAKGFRVQMHARTAVVDEITHTPLGVGEVGRIAQYGHVPLGYYNDPKKTAETFFERDGVRWVLLGDMGRREEDGTITVLGRGSQCINTGGEKVYPEEVEAVLKAHPAIFDTLVTGVPDGTYGHRVAAVVQLREGSELTAAEVQQHCRSKLAGYKLPRSIVFSDRIQRSPSGKPDYTWARKVAAGAGAGTGAVHGGDPA